MAKAEPERFKVRRLRAVHRKMSFAAFQRLPRRLGWKHEYYDGKAHLVPKSVMVTFLLRLTPHLLARRAGIRRVHPSDARTSDPR